MNLSGSTRKREMCTVLCAVAALFCSIPLHGQTPTGQIQLEVKDASGAAVQAAGQLEAVGGGVNRRFQTDAQGRYTLANLPFGRYRLEVSRTGFNSQTEQIDVQSTEAILRTVTMTVGTQTSK